MSARAVDPARSRIVLIGTPHYADERLPDVPVVANNIADLAAVFTDPELGGFDAAHCVATPPDAALAEIGEVLSDAADKAQDLLLIYYSGHGLLDRRGKLHLSLAATRPDRLGYSALPFETVRETCLDGHAANRVVILDSCFSGRAIGQPLADDVQQVQGQLAVSGTYTLASAPGNRTALILPGENHTAFTSRLLDALRDGLPDAGRLLTLREIYQHLVLRLRSEGLPVPQQRGTDTADLLGLIPNRRFLEERRKGPRPLRPAGVTAKSALHAWGATALEQAEDVVAQHFEARVSPRALANIARAVAVNDPDGAQNVIEQIYDEAWRWWAWSFVLRTIAITDPELAEDRADAIEDGGGRARATAVIARALVTTAPEVAARLADKAERELVHALARHRAPILADIAAAYAVTDLQRAESLVASAEAPWDQAWGLAGIARVVGASKPQAAARIADEAERSAQGIEDRGRKSETLASIAVTLSSSDADRAMRLADEALQLSEDWEPRPPGTPAPLMDTEQKAVVSAAYARVAVAATPQRAIRAAGDAVRRAAQIGNPPDRAAALARIAWLWLDEHAW